MSESSARGQWRPRRRFFKALAQRPGRNALDVSMVSIEHTDPVNARILSISEDKIGGFVREPFAEIARQMRTAPRNRARPYSRDAGSWNHPAGPPDAPGDQPRLRSARRLEGLTRKARRGLRFHVPGRSLFGTCSDPLNRRQNPRRGVQTLDYFESPGRLLAGHSLPGALLPDGSGSLSSHARQGNFRAGRRPRETQNHQSGR